MSSLLKGKAKQNKRNGGNGERPNLVAEWKDIELVFYLKELRLWGDYTNQPMKCFFFFFKLFVIQVLCEMLSVLQ